VPSPLLPLHPQQEQWRLVLPPPTAAPANHHQPQDPRREAVNLPFTKMAVYHLSPLHPSQLHHSFSLHHPHTYTPQHNSQPSPLTTLLYHPAIISLSHKTRKLHIPALSLYLCRLSRWHPHCCLQWLHLWLPRRRDLFLKSVLRLVLVSLIATSFQWIWGTYITRLWIAALDAT
jgi:hypothetical protein